MPFKTWSSSARFSSLNPCMDLPLKPFLVSLQAKPAFLLVVYVKIPNFSGSKFFLCGLSCSAFSLHHLFLFFIRTSIFGWCQCPVSFVLQDQDWWDQPEERRGAEGSEHMHAEAADRPDGGQSGEPSTAQTAMDHSQLQRTRKSSKLSVEHPLTCEVTESVCD